MRIEDPVLSLEGVRVTVPDGDARRTILDGADLHLAPGESVAITGASGSGKSTLLAVAGLLKKPDAGTVTIAGENADSLRDRGRTRLRRERIAFIYQSANLLPSLTAREQLELMAHIRREPRSEARERADRLLAVVGLEGRAGQLPGQLSGGERQRVGIARALMCRPDVILADEPTASLDPDLAEAIVDLLTTRSREAGVAILLVTHEESAAV
ncbi:MAG: ABC transporter ATP-binding protein, partial [Solirubrobacterales bacterium]|nr:ABC transporter ATP-binding protein [Solirubrobacterales bacterium]